MLTALTALPAEAERRRCPRSSGGGAEAKRRPGCRHRRPPETGTRGSPTSGDTRHGHWRPGSISGMTLDERPVSQRANCALEHARACRLRNRSRSATPQDASCGPPAPADAWAPCQRQADRGQQRLTLSDSRESCGTCPRFDVPGGIALTVIFVTTVCAAYGAMATSCARRAAPSAGLPAPNRLLARYAQC